jgi:hypothetical protein
MADSIVFLFTDSGHIETLPEPNVKDSKYSRAEKGDRIEYQKNSRRHHYATPPTPVA